MRNDIIASLLDFSGVAWKLSSVLWIAVVLASAVGQRCLQFPTVLVLAKAGWRKAVLDFLGLAWRISSVSWIVVVVVLGVCQRNLVFPTTLVPAMDGWRKDGVERVEIKTEDGETLRGYWRAPGPGGSVVVTFHGNGTSVVAHAARFAQLPWSNHGWGFLAIAYRGYPGSTGAPSENGLLADGEAAMKFVAEKAPAAAILLHGHSLGAGVAVAMAARHASKGVYLESAFNALEEAATDHFPFVPGILVLDAFRSDRRIGAIGSPVMEVHGGEDSIVRPAQGLALIGKANARSKYMLVEGVDHNSIFGVEDATMEKLFRDLPSMAPNAKR